MELSYHYKNLVDRAEAFRHLVNLVKHLPPELTSAVPTVAELPRQLPGGTVLAPRLTLDGNRLHCNDNYIDLSRRPMMKVFYRLCCEAVDGFVHRSEIEQSVYRIDQDAERSERMRECMQQNVVKLVSRARGLLEFHFPEAGVEWLTLDSEKCGWNVVRIVSIH